MPRKRKADELQSDSNENQSGIDPDLLKKVKNLKPTPELTAYSSAVVSLSLPEYAAAELTRFVSGCYDQTGVLEGLAGLAKCRIKAASKDFEGEAHRILMSQILSLNAVYEQHIKLASVVTDLEQRERLFTIAFKAQEQMRRTLDSLSDIKNPKKPSQFIKNYVNEQINQLKLEQPLQAFESVHEQPIHPQLEGLEDEPIDPRLETLGEKHRATYTDGEENLQP